MNGQTKRAATAGAADQVTTVHEGRQGVMKRFKVGDRIRIVGTHPHSGKHGQIVARSPVPVLDWIVELDGPYEPECGCSDSDLRRAP